MFTTLTVRGMILEDKLFSIYTLTDPRTSIVRYVGISCNVERRFSEHIGNIHPNNQTKRAWIQELADQRLIPILVVIERELRLEIAQKRKLYWIQYDLEQGRPLINISGVTAPWTGGIRVKKVKPAIYIHEQEMLLNTTEVAERLNVTRETVIRKIKGGKIPAYHTGTWLVSASDVDAYLKKRRYHKPEET